MKTQQIPHNLIMVTHEFGYPIYIAPFNSFINPSITDKKEEAEKWSAFDKTKIEFHKALTGYKGLVFETI